MVKRVGVGILRVVKVATGVVKRVELGVPRVVKLVTGVVKGSSQGC